jgi:hypothetical protein
MSADAPRIAEVEKRLFLPRGGHVVVPKLTDPKPRPRIQMIPYMEDLKRGPHLPMTPPAGPKRLVAYCCTCQQTVTNLPAHVEQFKEHRHAIRYVLLPDLRATSR